MTTLNLGVNEPPTQNVERQAVKTYRARADEGITRPPIPVSRVQRLDVDAVLARSLPKVVSE